LQQEEPAGRETGRRSSGLRVDRPITGAASMRRLIFALVIPMPLAILSALLVLNAETAAQDPPVAAPAPFNPGIADLMNIIVQPRHTKLWFAGKEGNWVLAAYEAKELRTALANVTKARPRFRDRPVGELIESFMGGPFRTMDDAVKEQDATKFVEAYAGVNAGCNACHVALSQSFVVIKTPEQPSYPDQDFRPQK
jgi:hypothetical protein